jgi:hypothetical protein
MAKLEKLIPWIAATIGAYAGWFLGVKLGLFVAFLLSVILGGVGLYLGKKWVADNL